MIMAGCRFMGDVPFRNVVLHGVVRDAQGRKMSKSLGNSLDPLEIIGKYSADALRFTLMQTTSPGIDVFISMDKFEIGRNFGTKIWNAARFLQMNLDGYEPGDPQPATAADRWILSRLAGLVARVDEGFDRFALAEVTHELYSFFWDEFCDWYVEFSKPRLYGEDAADRLTAQRNLVFVLDTALRLLHPFMPFVTEQIWRSLPHQGDAPTLMVAEWPEAAALSRYRDEDSEQAVSLVIDTVTAVRSIRARYGISPKEPLEVVVRTATAADAEALTALAPLAGGLATFKSFTAAADADKPAHAVAQLSGGVQAFIVLEGLIDFAAEAGRIKKLLAKTQKDLDKSTKKLANEKFVANAAPEAVAKERAKHDEFEMVIATLNEQLADLQG